MSRSIIHRLSYMLILGAILVFAGIGIYGVPRLLNAQVEITQPFEPESREQNLADKAPLGEVAVLVNTP
ncbi:MAG TPA: hypothetical protein ENJ56_04715, partial [Anaerolineae bacterium]|nr:hypothetical protein [Anaerolineae bacterium]